MHRHWAFLISVLLAFSSLVNSMPSSREEVCELLDLRSVSCLESDAIHVKQRTRRGGGSAAAMAAPAGNTLQR